MSPSNKKLARALQDAPKLVSATVGLMEELVRVLLQEIEVVSQRKVKEHPDLLKYKQKLAMDYRANMKSIAAQPDLLKKLSAEAKQAVREMAQRLAEVADRNARTLRAAVGATQQLIQNIVAMVRTEVMPRQAYKNSAKAHLQLGNYSPTCQPVAVSRSV
jgi:flagellar biosynthesis/type III secretory pathway chaperone